MRTSGADKCYEEAVTGYCDGGDWGRCGATLAAVVAETSLQM